MLKKILFAIICLVGITMNVFSQTVNITNISASGHFDPVASGNCNLGLPVITATFLSGTGTTISNGVITCTDPCGTTRVRINMSNIRWSKNPNVNWLHGISFTPANVTVQVPTGGLPAGWASFNSSSGSCNTAGSTTTGVGFYYDGTSQQACCPGITANDGNPSNNYGDVLADCNFDYSFFFDLTFCNSAITNNPLVFSARGTSDYQTGCWTGVDNIGTSRIQFVLATTPCTTPIFSTNPPTLVAPVKTCVAGVVNYTATLNAACGSGADVTWWTANTLGTQVGTGSPFVYDPAGSTCPSGTTLYAACCPAGNTCVTRRAVTISGTCPAALAITNVATTNPSCVTPTGSINSVTLSDAAPGTITYTLSPSGFTNTTGTFTGLTGLNYTLTATDASGCSANFPVVFVPGGTGGVPPTVTTPVAYCQGQTTGVTALVANTTSGTGVLTWYLPGSAVGQPTAPIPSTSNAGTFVYNVTQTIGTCVSAQIPITVTINPTPAAPTANSPINYCQGATATALVATGNGLKWYTSASSTVALSGAPIPLTSATGTTSYFVSQTTGTCEGPRKQIDVIVTATPAAPAVTANITYCQGVTATALNPTGTNLLWYTTASGLPAGTATSPIVSTALVGTTNYYVSQTVAGCESPRALITVTINATPAAPITVPISYCQNTTAVPLTATAITGASLIWYPIVTGGTGGPAPTPSTAVAGNTTYYVSQTINGCEGPRAALVVTIIGTPVAPSVSATSPTYCQGDAAVPLTVTTGTNLLWYTLPSGGASSATAPTPLTIAVGNTTYYVSQSTAGTPACEGPRASIIVRVNAKPAAPTVVTPLAYCQNIIAPVLTATGSNLLWYTTNIGGTGTTVLTPNTSAAGSTTYYVSQSALNCESPRAGIVVNVSPALTVNAGPDVTIAGGVTTQLNGVATAGADYTWTPNIPVTLSNPRILNPIANPAQTTTYRLTVVDLSGACLPVFDDVKVTVVQSCIKVRNAFSPNGDGINDTWLVYDQNFCLGANGATVKVFNRYGSKVYESKGYTNNWNGTYNNKALPDGTYFAIIDFVLFDGKTQQVRTDLTILR
jgi:gliding motility-associated-like protein